MPRQLPPGHATRATMAVRRAKACGRGEELAGPGGEEDRLAGCSECWDEDVLHHWDQLLSRLRWVRHRKLTLAVFSRRPQGEFTDSLEISASTEGSGDSDELSASEKTNGSASQRRSRSRNSRIRA